jgi:DNA-directed RNA polymerase sigma subunit (sigma70/sigma32)
MPDSWCPLAVLRLKAIRNAGRELTEEEEALLPGCPWAIDHQLAHYCFFKYLAEYTTEKSVSDIELAALLNVSVETIKKIEKTGLTKMREHKSFADLKSDGSAVVSESEAIDYKIYR